MPDFVGNLLALPRELEHLVGAELDLESLCAIRLVSRRAQELFRVEFLRYFRDQTVALSQPSIDRLCALAARPEFGGLVRSLRVTFVPSDDRSISAPSGPPLTGVAMRDLLAKALRGFSNLSSISLESNLASSLEAANLPVPAHLPPIRRKRKSPTEAAISQASSSVGANTSKMRYWSPAIQAYHVLTSAIAHADLQRLVDLSILAANSPRCGVPIDEVVMPLDTPEDEDFARILAGLKSFSIGVSPPLSPKRVPPAVMRGGHFYEPPDVGETVQLPTNPDGDTVAEEPFPEVIAFGRLLRLMRGLESLELRMFYPRCGQLVAHGRIRAFHSSLLATLFQVNRFNNGQQQPSTSLPFRDLSSLCLRGFWLVRWPMLAILANYSRTLRSLDLRAVSFAAGLRDWGHLFAFVQQNMLTSLARLSLSRLEPKMPTVYLDLSPRGDYDEQLPPRHADESRHTRVWDADALSQYGLDFLSTKGEPYLGSLTEDTDEQASSKRLIGEYGAFHHTFRMPPTTFERADGSGISRFFVRSLGVW